MFPCRSQTKRTQHAQVSALGVCTRSRTSERRPQPLVAGPGRTDWHEEDYCDLDLDPWPVLDCGVDDGAARTTLSRFVKVRTRAFQVLEAWVCPGPHRSVLVHTVNPENYNRTSTFSFGVIARPNFDLAMPCCPWRALHPHVLFFVVLE